MQLLSLRRYELSRKLKKKGKKERLKTSHLSLKWHLLVLTRLMKLKRTKVGGV
jgi:hypothetical protein